MRGENCTWHLDTTQADSLELTIMIHDGASNRLTSKHIGHFSMFFDDIGQVRDFLEGGLSELESFVEVMEELAEKFDSFDSLSHSDKEGD